MSIPEELVHCPKCNREVRKKRGTCFCGWPLAAPYDRAAARRRAAGSVLGLASFGLVLYGAVELRAWGTERRIHREVAAIEKQVRALEGEERYEEALEVLERVRSEASPGVARHFAWDVSSMQGELIQRDDRAKRLIGRDSMRQYDADIVALRERRALYASLPGASARSMLAAIDQGIAQRGKQRDEAAARFWKAQEPEIDRLEKDGNVEEAIWLCDQFPSGASKTREAALVAARRERLARAQGGGR